MTRLALERRLAVLETREGERRERVRERVLPNITDADLDILIDVCRRHEADRYTEPTPAERDALQRVDALVLADVEGRQSDCVLAWHARPQKDDTAGILTASHA